jgi:hypothetical protein
MTNWSGWSLGYGLDQGWRTNFKEIYSRALGNFEEQNKVLEPSMIIINCCTITISAFYNDIA